MAYILYHPDVAVWAVLIIVFAITEAVTSGLISIWFSIGALAGMLIALIGLPVWMQILVFLVVSGIILLVTLPLSERMINQKTVKTNADRVLGATGIVTETIDNLSSKGRVEVLGQSWRACSSDSTIIPIQSFVAVKEIDGVKLIVETVRGTVE